MKTNVVHTGASITQIGAAAFLRDRLRDHITPELYMHLNNIVHSAHRLSDGEALKIGNAQNPYYQVRAEYDERVQTILEACIKEARAPSVPRDGAPRRRPADQHDLFQLERMVQGPKHLHALNQYSMDGRDPDMIDVNLQRIVEALITSRGLFSSSVHMGVYPSDQERIYNDFVVRMNKAISEREGIYRKYKAYHDDIDHLYDLQKANEAAYGKLHGIKDAKKRADVLRDLNDEKRKIVRDIDAKRVQLRDAPHDRAQALKDWDSANKTLFNQSKTFNKSGEVPDRQDELHPVVLPADSPPLFTNFQLCNLLWKNPDFTEALDKAIVDRGYRYGSTYKNIVWHAIDDIWSPPPQDYDDLERYSPDDDAAAAAVSALTVHDPAQDITA